MPSESVSSTNPKPDSPEKHQVVANTGDRVNMAVSEGNWNAIASGTAEEWIEALNVYRGVARHRIEMVKAISGMMSVSELWAKDRLWVEEVGIFFPKESDRAVTLVAAVQQEDIGAREHSEVSALGLALGGVFGLIVEPRVIIGRLESYPQGWMSVFKKS